MKSYGVIVRVLLVIVLLFSFLPSAYAETGAAQLKLYLNGKRIGLTEAPVMKNRVLYVPVQVLSELGTSVQWNDEKDRVTISKAQTKVEFQLASKLASINGKEASLNAAPYEVRDTWMVPLRSVAEPLGMRVLWDHLTRSVFLYDKQIADSTKVENVVDVKPVGNHNNSGTGVKQQTETKPIENAAGAENTNDPVISDGQASVVNDGSSGSPSIGAIEMTDQQVVIRATSKLTYKHFVLADPNRIVVDLPGASLATTVNGASAGLNGIVPGTGNLIKSARYSMFSQNPKAVRVVLDLNQSVAYGVSLNSDGTALTIAMKTSTYKVVLDAGHGGKDPGASGASGRFEKLMALEVAQKVRKLLEKEPQIQVMMTREGDSFVSLDERAKMANDWNADLFISIHGNTYEKPISGTETYYYNSNSLLFANVMHKNLLEATKLPDRGVRKNNFVVVKKTQMPAVLLELGYLSTRSDEAKLLQEETQNRIAEAIVKSIKSYLGLS